MIANKKLVKTGTNDYRFILDGCMVAGGSLESCVPQLRRFGILEADLKLAVEVMAENGHDVADFGVAGRFIISLSFEEAHLGPLTDWKYKEAQ